jgi:hypothetical protein
VSWSDAFNDELGSGAGEHLSGCTCEGGRDVFDEFSGRKKGTYAVEI